MKFTKMHGCGNDYVYVDGFKNKIDDPGTLAKKVSDRHFSIGSDGLIIIDRSNVADFKMRMYNADGSEGKMCGNGIRCLAKYVYDNHMTDKKQITVETLSGIKTLDLKVKDGLVDLVRVNMGSPIFDPSRIPVSLQKNEVIDFPLDVDGKTYNITCVSMGNPHAVTFVDDVSKIEIEKTGPILECHPIFPDRANIEFVKVIDKSRVQMRVWERGSGETLACGTGACAVAAACVKNKLTNNTLDVVLPGGTLLVEYDTERNEIYMTGPAKVSYTGNIDI